ncbi:hypothetical protein F5Y07DRAFT_363307 [Xylaria sp. FL0933]|nr:hypothetical protein F5Y07DRAFT_363307 [Xylaria sp. FL0933]
MDTVSNASASAGDQYPVYVGVWTNWSRGRVFGSTLTLSRRDADLLIAFTAFFIAFVTTRVWRIICFVFHRIYSTADPGDAIYHQRQTIFRNSSSPESGIEMLLWLLWANRHSKAWLRPLLAAIVAILCISIFTIAGGFSSRISTAVGDEVLIDTSNCGYIPAASRVNSPSYFTLAANEATIINSAANYAQQCYSSDNTGLLDCNRFATQQVKKIIDSQADCPFKSHLCRNKSANLRIDSGFLDTHDVLGFNAPSDKRILFRNVLHCAPLTTAGYKRESLTSAGNYTFYQYGAFVGSPNETTDYVHAAPSIEAQYAPSLSNDIGVSSANYALNSYVACVENRTPYAACSSFLPTHDIFREDADTILHFLSGNGVEFSQFSADEWYRIDPNPVITPVLEDPKAIFLREYVPEEPASPLGCTNQYQFCNAAFEGTSGCGPLASVRDAIAGAAPFFETTYAEFTNQYFTNETGALFLYFANMYFSTSSQSADDVVKQLGATALTSQKTLISGIQGPIASHQWQQDVIHWWDISVAVQQSASLSQAYFPDDSNLLAARVNYTAPEFQKLCSNQKIRTTAYASFSLFGLFFTLTAGLLLTLVSYLVEPISGWLSKRKGYNRYPHLEWTANSTLQLQRLAHEELGFGTWSRGTKTIPVTKPDQLLGSLDVSDPKHPVLRRLTDTDSASLTAGSSTEAPVVTVVGNGSEHTCVSLATSDDASDFQDGVNILPQNGTTSDNTLIWRHQPNTETRTESPSDGPPSEQTAQSKDSEHLPTTQGASGTLVVDPVGGRMG